MALPRPLPLEPSYLDEQKAKAYSLAIDEGRKRVIGFMAAILAARRLAEFDPSRGRVPATITAIHDAVGWAERILAEIDKRWPDKR